jgi:hypothetical protein
MRGKNKVWLFNRSFSCDSEFEKYIYDTNEEFSIIKTHQTSEGGKISGMANAGFLGWVFMGFNGFLGFEFYNGFGFLGLNF